MPAEVKLFRLENGPPFRRAALLRQNVVGELARSRLEAVLEFELHDALVVAAEPLLEVLSAKQVCGVAVCIAVTCARQDGAARIIRSTIVAG